MFQTVNDKVMLSPKAYDVFKSVAMVWLPGFGALYYGLAQIWGLPGADQVVGTVTVVDTFLGLGLKKSQTNYDASGAAFDGEALVGTDPDGNKKYTMQFNDHPYGLDQKDNIKLKVVPYTLEATQPEAP